MEKHNELECYPKQAQKKPSDADDSIIVASKFTFIHNSNIKGSRENEVSVPPRPMSWDGELSDVERDMSIDEYADTKCEPHNYVTSADSSKGTLFEKMKTNISTATSVVAISNNISPVDSIPHSLQRSPHNSPLLGRQISVSSISLTLPISNKDALHKVLNVPPTPSPDSAVHSAYSVFSSPNHSPITQRHTNLTPTLSRNNSDASHSSCCSYSSVSISVTPPQQYSPTHSPVQGRHVYSSPISSNNILRNLQDDLNYHKTQDCDVSDEVDDKLRSCHTPISTQSGISRQQLINSPCPICGDKISGFHYGIFSCESCKGFFKRTVQNRKNYVCLRGAACPVTITTRKKCPACRFEKCLQCGMKLEAIREDRTRGGRSTYQCSYSLPPSLSCHHHSEIRIGDVYSQSSGECVSNMSVKLEPSDNMATSLSKRMNANLRLGVPPLLQDIMAVEHLWHYNEMELQKLNSSGSLNKDCMSDEAVLSLSTHPLLAGTGLAESADTSPDFIADLCNIADHRLYKIVKWCKSLPLFKNISIDDQICLLINSWCELLLFSCCFRSISSPGEIRLSLGKSISLQQAREMGMNTCIERMLNFTEQLRRLRVDRYEYVAMKAIVLLISDTTELRETDKVRASQEKALKALQDYTLSHYPESPAKFGELLLRIPELQRTCQIGKEMLTIKSKNSDGPSFNLLMELLRGDH